MDALISLLPLVLSLGIMAALLKLTARLWRSSKITWLRALGYVLLIMLVTALAGTLRGGTSISLPLSILLGVAVHTSLGGLYLGRLASTPDGVRLGFRGGALLALVYIALLATVTLVPALIYFALRGEA